MNEKFDALNEKKPLSNVWVNRLNTQRQKRKITSVCDFRLRMCTWPLCLWSHIFTQNPSFCLCVCMRIVSLAADKKNGNAKHNFVLCALISLAEPIDSIDSLSCRWLLAKNRTDLVAMLISYSHSHVTHDKFIDFNAYTRYCCCWWFLVPPILVLRLAKRPETIGNLSYDRDFLIIRQKWRTIEEIV